MEKDLKKYAILTGADMNKESLSKKIKEIPLIRARFFDLQGYFWKKEKKFQKPVLRDKIYTETLMSLDLAQKIVPLVRKLISPAKYDLEIHIDVGSLGPTREMIREVVGMVTGNGFTAKTKPDSWGASSVADKHT